MSRKPTLLALFVLAALPLAGCSKGEECDTCDTDADCKSGLFCVNFKDENGNPAGKRCGSGIGATNCRVRWSPAHDRQLH